MQTTTKRSAYAQATTPEMRLSGCSAAAMSQRSLLATLRPRHSDYFSKILQAPSVRQVASMQTAGVRVSSFVSNCSSLGAAVPMLEDGDDDDVFKDREFADDDEDEPTGLMQFDALKHVVHTIANADGAIDKQTFKDTFGMDLPDAAMESVRCASFLLTAAMEMDLADDEKLRLIFNTMDAQSTGLIDRGDVVTLLRAKFASVKLKCKAIHPRVGTDYSSLADILFAKAHAAHKTHIDYAQFCHVFRDYIKDATTVVTADCLKSTKSTHRTNVFFTTTSSLRHDHASLSSLGSNVHAWYLRNRLRLWWGALYIVFCLYQGIGKAMKFPVDSAVGWSLRIARGMAQVSMSNMFLALLPMCRSVVEIVKTHTPLGRFIPFDDVLAFHRVAGAVSLLAGLIHTGAHVYNEVCLYLVVSPDRIHRSFLVAHISTLRGPNGEALVPPFHQFVMTLPILTGVVMLVIALLVLSTALIPWVRQRHFNLFWYCHVSLGLFLAAGCLHGAMSWLATAQSFFWILPPLSIYLLERRVRFLKYFPVATKTVPVAIQRDRTTIYKQSSSEDTLALFLDKPPSFRYTPGMYTFVNVPAISTHEWHPFTISSAPCDPYVSLHIRNAGDWTCRLHELIDQGQFPALFLDGPVGAPTQAYSQYKTILMVGGGIGVTPFASVLKDVVTEMRSRKAGGRVCPDFHLEKLYFHWTTRQQDSLRWFEDTMNDLHALDDDNMFETHQHLTSVKEHDTPEFMKLFQAMVHKETGTDVVSGLHTGQLTHFGRPKWDQIFHEIASTHVGETIGVFFCGPHIIDVELDRLCRQHTSNGTRFEYHSEKFA
ncbi:hypothetical protein DYB25_004314 [Aphanomyces astaci]|uniref:FAD-binding FR-type domain-containing protein n=1 Tax=Aphanomyces astaci TaxID=112090 RepID=A0A397A7V0_APHAT|nr:hypothetical protein DYB25_004314 [Aphanomyces astaci]